MKQIILHDVGLRDGLQNEKAIVPTEQKVRWLEALVQAGVDVVQVGSFVHKEKVPQMADTDDLFRIFKQAGRAPGRARLSALVLNEKGMERAFACGVDYLCMGVSASDTHSRKNTGMGTAEAADRIIAMGKAAREAGAAVQVSVQSAFGCGFEGVIPEPRIMNLVRRFLDAGLVTVSLADTAGHGTPDQVERLFAGVMALDAGVECACHLHDTYGLGMANAYAAMRVGVKYFEAAFGGLGGCPFTKIAGGNLCTEDFVHMIQRMGHRSDIRLDALIELSKDAGCFFGREMAGRVWKSGPVRTVAAV
ncbi:MAG: hydroxymethylglutaryl-CoA lyase [Acidobacteria bacterium]|nr:MAG: hydroxymethylglutaryl-CoA lyase [Acidobacteriota bacterium]